MEKNIAPVDIRSISAFQKRCPKWLLLKNPKRLKMKFMATSFDAAINIINSISDLANKADHHPDIHLTKYNVLAIELRTHAVDDLTCKDISLAKDIDAMLLKYSK